MSYDHMNSIHRKYTTRQGKNSGKDKIHMRHECVMDHYSKVCPILRRIPGWRRFQGMIASPRRFGEREGAQQRLQDYQAL
jgi:hypothetical protein